MLLAEDNRGMLISFMASLTKDGFAEPSRSCAMEARPWTSRCVEASTASRDRDLACG